MVLSGRGLVQTHWAPAVTVGILVMDGAVIALVYVLLAFPTGRLRSRREWLIFGPVVLAAGPLELVWLLFLELPGGLNLLAIWPDEGIADAVDWVQRVQALRGQHGADHLGHRAHPAGTSGGPAGEPSARAAGALGGRRPARRQADDAHAVTLLERDLHDGAQRRLVTLSMSLGMLERRLEDDPEARALVAGAGTT